MQGKSTTVARGDSLDAEPLFSFVETGVLEPRPRLLVERLLFARALLQASPVLAPRFMLGDCAAAHHIVFGGAATGALAAERLLGYGFRVEPSADPPGIRFFLSSSHTEPEIRALLVAIAIVVRELSVSEQPALASASSRHRVPALDPGSK
jgi:hypothetical protein